VAWAGVLVMGKGILLVCVIGSALNSRICPSFICICLSLFLQNFLYLFHHFEYIIASLFGFIWDSARPMFCKREEVFRSWSIQTWGQSILQRRLWWFSLLCTNARRPNSCSGPSLWSRVFRDQHKIQGYTKPFLSW
jgi:hypothetical protein